MGSPKGEISQGFQSYNFELVTREEWQAKERVYDEKLNVPKLPYKLVFDHFTENDPCSTAEDCMRTVQTIQEKDMTKGYNDIRFNFLIGGDGRVYEGRGWQVSASRSLNNATQVWRKRLDIAFIGEYFENPIPDIMMKRFHEIIYRGVKEVLIEKVPTSYHMRKGIPVLPVETTRDDFVGSALLQIQQEEEENDEVLRDKRERERAVKARKEEENNEGVKKKFTITEEEIPYSDCPCESHYKKAQEDDVYRDVERRMLKEFWESSGIRGT